MKYEKGDRVVHPKKEEWGLGEVLADSDGETVRVFFVGAGEKKLTLSYVQPTRVPSKDASHPMLDNLKINKTTTGIKYQSLPDSVQVFLSQFPEGFYGAKFHKHERGYKENAHALAHDLLRQESFRALLKLEDYDEVVRRALKIVNASNLIFPNEKMALKDGLGSDSSKKGFSGALFKLLFGSDEIEHRFGEFCSVLEEVNAAKWTNATYFLFIVHPDRYMFVKPTITQHAAELCGFEINYKPRLNWLTYKCVLDFSNYLFHQLIELKPRDMIDVQSFMWCIAPGKYGNA